MAIIDANHPALQGDSSLFWKEEISNSKILLFEIDIAIDRLTKSKYSSYTINTGQDQWTVKYTDLPLLYDKRRDLIKQIIDLEDKLQADAGPSVMVVRPV